MTKTFKELRKIREKQLVKAFDIKNEILSMMQLRKGVAYTVGDIATRFNIGSLRASSLLMELAEEKKVTMMKAGELRYYGVE